MSAIARLISLPLPLLSNAISAARVPAERRWPYTCALFPRPQSKMFATRASTSVIARSRSLQSARARAMAQIELRRGSARQLLSFSEPSTASPSASAVQPPAKHCIVRGRHSPSISQGTILEERRR